MKKRRKKHGNPIAKALNKVNKPVTMIDKKKELNKLKCRKVIESENINTTTTVH